MLVMDERTADTSSGAIERLRGRRVTTGKLTAQFADRAAAWRIDLDLSANDVREPAVEQDPQASLLRSHGVAARQPEVNRLGQGGGQVYVRRSRRLVHG